MIHLVKNGRSAPAFTLVELLVVITIVVLLISMLLPTLGEAVEKSRQVVCLSNQRQLFYAAQGYSNDYKDGMPALTYSLIGPLIICGDSTTIDRAGRRTFLANYTTADPQLIGGRWQMNQPVKYMYCPSGVRLEAPPFAPDSNYDYWGFFYQTRAYSIDYMVSGAGQFSWGSGNDDYGIPLKRFSALGDQDAGGQKVVFSMDYETTYQPATGQSAAASQWPITWFNTPHKDQKGKIAPRGMNAVYVDGSGKWSRYDSVQQYAPAGTGNGVQVQWSDVSTGNLGGGVPTYFPFLYPASSRVMALWTNTGLVAALNDPTSPPASVFVYSSDQSLAQFNGGPGGWATGWYPANQYGY